MRPTQSLTNDISPSTCTPPTRTPASFVWACLACIHCQSFEESDNGVRTNLGLRLGKNRPLPERSQLPIVERCPKRFEPRRCLLHLDIEMLLEPQSIPPSRFCMSRPSSMTAPASSSPSKSLTIRRCHNGTKHAAERGCGGRRGPEGCWRIR